MSLAIDPGMNIQIAQYGLLAGLWFGGGLALAAGDAQALQDHGTIRNAAVAEIHAVLSGSGTRVVAEAEAIDGRLRLPQCSEALAAELPFGSTRSNRITVEVRCAGAQPWKVYIPVRLATYGPVVVAARAISRDQILGPDDLVVTELELSGLRQGHLSDPNHIVGKKMRRGIAAGAPITA